MNGLFWYYRTFLSSVKVWGRGEGEGALFQQGSCHVHVTSEGWIQQSAGSADAVLLSCWDSGALFVSLSARLSSNRCPVYLGNPFVHWKAFLHSPNNQTPLYPFIFVFVKEIVLK